MVILFINHNGNSWDAIQRLVKNNLEKKHTFLNFAFCCCCYSVRMEGNSKVNLPSTHRSSSSSEIMVTRLTWKCRSIWTIWQKCFGYVYLTSESNPKPYHMPPGRILFFHSCTVLTTTNFSTHSELKFESSMHPVESINCFNGGYRKNVANDWRRPTEFFVP